MALFELQSTFFQNLNEGQIKMQCHTSTNPNRSSISVENMEKVFFQLFPTKICSFSIKSKYQLPVINN